MLSVKEKRSIVQGELADLSLYTALRKRAQGAFAETLDHFILTEQRHVAFWQKTLNISEQKPSWLGQLRNVCILAAVRIFGSPAGFLLLEAVESHGISQYLALAEHAKDDSTTHAAIRSILTEELQHEDEAATGGQQTINGSLVRNAFLGFNDGSVEILGAVSGFVAAFQKPELIVLAAGTVSVAGAVSMAAGAFLSTHAERELARTAAAKARFLDQPTDTQTEPSPWTASLIVGTGYMLGAFMPVLPFLLGAHSPLWSILLSGSLILLVSAFLSFLSGMRMQQRILLNIVIITAAVLISYGIGSGLDHLMGA